MAETFLSTRQAAKRARISHETLYTWMERGLVCGPEPVRIGNRSLRLWTLADVRKLVGVRKRIYRMGEGRPRKETNEANHAKNRE